MLASSASKPEVVDTDRILLNPRGKEVFMAFLQERGCDVLVPTNPYELLRFKRHGRTNIVYRKSNGRLTIVGNDVELAIKAFLASRQRAAPARRGVAQAVIRQEGPATRRIKLRGSAVHKALLARDGVNCFYCGKRLGDDQTKEHLLSIAHGGTDHIANLALVHHACNVKAGDLPLVEKVKLRERMRRRRR